MGGLETLIAVSAYTKQYSKIMALLFSNISSISTVLKLFLLKLITLLRCFYFSWYVSACLCCHRLLLSLSFIYFYNMFFSDFWWWLILLVSIFEILYHNFRLSSLALIVIIQLTGTVLPSFLISVLVNQLKTARNAATSDPS